MPPPPGYTAADLVFADSFCGSGLDATKWTSYIDGFNDNGQLALPLSGPNGNEDELEYWSPSQVSVQDGLTITATPDATKMQLGYTVKSGVITSVNSKQFTHGGPSGRTFVQVRARTPARDGMWAQVSLAAPFGKTVAVFGTGFLATEGMPAENFNTGVMGANDATFYTGADLSTGPSDFGMELVWGQSVTWTWNPVGAEPRQVRQVTGAAGIPNVGEAEAIWIVLRVVDAQAAAWHTTWAGDADAFQVRAIRVYER